MTATAIATHTIDSILDLLDQFRQRATYGAVAGVVNSSPRSLMSGRARDQRSSWIVSRETKQPSGYSNEQIHPDLTSRSEVIGNPDDLRKWLENPA
jgi:hypothetical protein